MRVAGCGSWQTTERMNMAAAAGRRRLAMNEQTADES
jgi:hypothetical protein